MFTDVLPHKIRKRPRGYILHTDPSDKPRSHWVAMYLTEDESGEFGDSYGQVPGFYSQKCTQFLSKHCSTFTWNRRVLRAPSSDVCGQNTLYFASKISFVESSNL